MAKAPKSADTDRYVNLCFFFILYFVPSVVAVYATRSATFNIAFSPSPPCSITVEFLDEFNAKKTAIEKRIEAVQ